MFACLWEYSLLFNLRSSLRRISKSSSLCVSRFSWWNHLVVGFCLYRAFWWQILFHFQWSLCSSYCFFEIPFWGLCVPGKLSFSSRLLDCLAHKSSHCSLTDFLYFCDICWCFSFFISYFLWICSLFLVSLVKGWSILCTLSENQFLVYCIFFISILFIYFLSMVIVTDFIFLDSKITVDSECSLEIKRRLLLGRKTKTNLDSELKHRHATLPTKVRLDKALVFLVVLYGCELDHKEGWAPKNWCFWTVVLEKTLESPLNSKGIKAVNTKGNQSWILTGRTDAEGETPILWLPDANSRLIRKDLDAGSDWGREEKGTTEDEMVGWHHRLTGHELGQTLGDSEGQESLQFMGSQSWTWLGNWTTKSWFTVCVSRGSQASLDRHPLFFRFFSHLIITQYWVESLCYVQ